MTDKDIEAKLRTAVEHAVPDVWEQIMAKCQQAEPPSPVSSLSEGKRLRQRRALGRWALAAAALVLLLGGAGGYGHYQNNYVACATIALEVNPNMELVVSRSERVLSVKALNADAEALLAEKVPSGQPLAETLDDVVETLMTEGYLSEEANAVLLTVEQSDAAKGAALAEKAASEVESSMAKRDLDGAVLSQTITDRQTLASLADSCGISVGKAALITELTTQEGQYAAEELKTLSINELGTLLASANIPAEGVKLQGAPSEKAYIGAEQALRMAREAAQLGAEQAQSVRLAAAQGTMVYQIELTSAEATYRYTLDAYSGDLLAQSCTAHQIAVQPPEDTQAAVQPETPASAQPVGQDHTDHDKDVGQDYADQYKDVGQEYADQYKDIGQEYADHYKDVGQDYADQYKDVGQDYADQYKDVGQHYADQYKDVGQDYADQYKDIGQDYADQYKDIGQDYADQYKDVGQDYADQYKDVGQDYADQYKDVGQEYADRYKGVVQEYRDAVNSAGQSDDSGSSEAADSSSDDASTIGQHFADTYKEIAQHYADQFTGGRDRAVE